MWFPNEYRISSLKEKKKTNKNNVQAHVISGPRLLPLFLALANLRKLEYGKLK